MQDRILGAVCRPRRTPGAGGPPFLTDDPEPVAYKYYEAYTFGTFDHSNGGTFAQAPAFEFNAGVAPNLQLHLSVPTAFVRPGIAYGLGDTEVGSKYRFITERRGRPQVGVFPLLELPSGNSVRFRPS